MEKKRKEKPKYESRARFFGTERRPAQKPTPMSPTHGTHPRKCTKYSGKRTQPLARQNLHRIGFRNNASNSDPGPTAWRLLHLETRGLTGTLL
ncbi:hypothetical protein V1477_004116 [Vespula maculifrons]|uniref:Uncharacterized protein n=1 Tax=Vespula maculifrons TaxID=7453 RepID=A0ABD2CRK5_VESMC